MHQLACTALAGLAHDGGAAGAGFFEQVLANGLQAGCVGKTGNLDLAQHLCAAAASAFDRHRAVLANRDAGHVGRDGDGRLERRTVGGDQLSGCRQLEAAVTRVSDGAVGLGDLEKTIALYRQIEGVFGGDQAALGVGFFGGHDAHTGAQHQARGGLRVGTHLGAGLAQVLVEHVLEAGAVALEAGRVDVGQVVRDDRHARLLRIQAGLGNPH